MAKSDASRKREGLPRSWDFVRDAIRTQRRVIAHSALDRVRQAATKDRKAKFTALLHHVTLDRLRAASGALARHAAAGVDGMIWAAYGEGLEARLASPLQSIATASLVNTSACTPARRSRYCR